MPESTLDPILAALSYEVIEWLRSFRYDRSFKEIAGRFGRDERTVSQQLQRLDQAFWDTQQVHILDREFGRKTYRLTRAGEAFVNRLEVIPEMTRAAIDAATTVSRRIPILCTSNCLSYLRDLSDGLGVASGFNIVPESRRTADVDLTFPENGPDRHIGVCLSSAMMSSEQDPRVGSIAQWNERVEVLVLRIDRFKLLCVGDRQPREPVTVRELVEDGMTFMTPRGGVVWDFLNRSFPGWWKLRPFQYVQVGDLDFGLRCLASGLVEPAAMVVHGVELEDLESYGLDHPRLLDFAVGGSHRLVAITGVFRVRHENPDDQDPYDLVWKTAQSLWAEKERTL
ncbi:hypothetical protein [Actinoallomurus soli]|uniref:hypothetical protein n=1 Tax=Actinoallomurus soli TaxID=2952535 RepID=UPI00209345DE|nr:hypothetical protein [Actinoallomurus soli]MCO5971560.1 hypothetical protein [Actinoallomurus soli]